MAFHDAPTPEDLPIEHRRCQPIAERCSWCQNYMNRDESNAVRFDLFCTLACEQASADVERIR